MTIDEVMNKAMLLRSATDELVVIDQLYEAIAAYGAAERERCAVVCDQEASLNASAAVNAKTKHGAYGFQGIAAGCQNCAEVIRALD